MDTPRLTAGASVLVSAVIGAVVLYSFLDRPEPPRPEPPREVPKHKPAVTPPPRVMPAPLPKTQTPPPAATAFRLPAPPPPKVTAKPKPVAQPKPLPKPAARPAPKPLEKIARAAPPPPKAAPKPVRLKPKPKPKPKPRPAVERNYPEPPPLIRRRDAAPLSLAPKPRVVRRPPLRPIRPAPAGPPETVIPTRATRREGRTLLRLLEYGKGPAIEIAWPDTAGTRDRLYRRFRACFGMRNAIMDGDGKLYGEDGPTGEPWAINLDRYSGFVRHPAGRTIAAERNRARTIARRHGVDGRLVRIFPRNVDAVILGGLHQVIGGAYRDARTITATYRRRDGRLVLAAIRVNGRPLEGAVDISAVRRRGCTA